MNLQNFIKQRIPPRTMTKTYDKEFDPVCGCELEKPANFWQEWEDIKWFSKDSTKNLTWIEDFCTVDEQADKVKIWIDPIKSFEAGIDTVPKLEEAFELFNNFVREASRRRLVSKSSAANDHMINSFFIQNIQPLYDDANKVIITKNLEIFTQSTALAKKQKLENGEKYVGPLKAWTKWDCKCRRGKWYYRGFIQNPKAVNKS